MLALPLLSSRARFAVPGASLCHLRTPALLPGHFRFASYALAPPPVHSCFTICALSFCLLRSRSAAAQSRFTTYALSPCRARNLAARATQRSHAVLHLF
ncbi:hypothetical protein PLICRDRAFT_55944 [Plicaturopsis crispa FD-325 SS-3]|nr:hypothetical protein PLICRDRAFT_55944 [Plicaturopsis crispa FD-325 SS-3]